MPDKDLAYKDIITEEEKIKEDFLNRCIDHKLAFVTLHGGYIFHVLNLYEGISLSAFKETDFVKFLNEGTVIAFKPDHEQLEAAFNGQEKVLKFMELNLPFEKYSKFEAWVFNQL